MKVEKLVIKNFMPYKGEQEIEFPQHDTQNVMLLFGDNMRGKTSFLNTIRWAFYGVALGRHMREIRRVDLVNRDACAENDWIMSVSIYFGHEGKSYELTRKIEKRDNVTKAKNDADFKEDIGLRIDGEVVAGDLVDNEINQVMPKEVSRFFLFDGELLQEYENLLNEENEQGKKIKKHIESVLGVPALINARDELKSLLKDARTIQRKDAQKNDDLKSLAQDLKTHQVKLDSLESNLMDLHTQKNGNEIKVDEISDFLRNTEAVQAKKIEIEGLAAKKTQYEEAIDDSLSSTQVLLKSAWKDILCSSVADIVSDLRGERDDCQQQQNDAIRLQTKIDE
ncbi:AAA family ATPase, partial [Halieaceae bacterium]|nr:AAA family ATPase [Halieaceae bacterium]